MTCLKINRLYNKYSTSLQQTPEAEEAIIQSSRVYGEHKMGDLLKNFRSPTFYITKDTNKILFRFLYTHLV